MGTKIRKKLIASVIAVLTVLNFMLIPVSAAEGDVTVTTLNELQTAINNASQATTIVLGADITLGNNALSIGNGKEITIDLDGHKITRASQNTNSNYLINVGVGNYQSGTAKLTLKDSGETGAISGANGAPAIHVGKNGTFVMESGSITGNKASASTNQNASNNKGGAVFVNSSGTFVMKGGTISKNSAGFGGGVAVADNGKFDLINGVISENTTYNVGGGIWLEDSGAVCTIYGGSIINNVAHNDSNAQTYTSDRGAGIYFGHYATLNFGKENSGIDMSTIIISGNYDSFPNGEEREDNLYISLMYAGQQQRHYLHIYQGFTADSSIGLCVSFANSNEDVKATIGYLKYNEDLDPNAVFFLDQGERALALEADGEIHCVKHSHDLKYTVDKNVLHAYCDKDITTGKKCTLQADLTLNASDADYTGDPVAASLTGIEKFKRVTGYEANEADIKYYKADDEDNALASAPSEVGSYIAKYTATIDAVDYTIVQPFAIGCVDHAMVCDRFEWTGNDTDGYTAAKAFFKCTSCSDEQEVPAEVTFETTEATYTTDGKIVYTATVAEEKSPSGNIETDTRTVTIDHQGHKYSFVNFTWDPKAEGEGYNVVANYKCDNCKDEQTVDPTVTSTKTEPTCTDAGSIVYKATVEAGASLDNTAHEDEKTDVLAALGHDWRFVDITFTPKADGEGYDAVANYKCDRCKLEDTVKATVTSKTTNATCTEAGETVYTATVTAENSLDKAAHDATQKDEIPATGHDWKFVDFSWEEDKDNGGFKAVANYVCKNDNSHETTVAATVTSEKTDPTCEDGGKIVYTAVVTAADSLDKADHDDKLTVDIDPNGHVWEFVDFTWTEAKDGFTAKANYVCKTDDTHKKSVDAKVESKTTDATCEKDGETVYTATVSAEDSLDKAAQSDTKTVVITATGHDWDKTTYTWSADNSTVTAKRVCKNDKTHVEEETVKTTSKITKNPSVGATGVRTFTSAEFKNPAFKVQTKNIDLAKLTPTPTTPADDPSVKLKINKSNLTLVCGKTDTLKASLVGAKAAITWKSSNPKIATVDANGKITAKMAGSVTITASAVGKKTTCTVQVLFKDVTNSKDFWYTPTYYMTDKNVVKGYDNQTMFKPANICTRAQMVTFIWRLVGQPAPKTTTMKFKDVKKSDYFYQACLWGNENHIVEGYKDGTFGPKINCARRHAVTFLWRLAGKPDPKTTKNKFSDLKKDDYFYKATLWASEMKILEGYNDGTFRPNGDCLRRQMVTFLYKYDKFIKKG